MAASTSIISSSLYWFNQSMDLFLIVESGDPMEFSSFQYHVICIESEIYRRAFDQTRFRIHPAEYRLRLLSRDYTIQLLPSRDYPIRKTYDEMMKLPPHERIAFLVNSLFFNSMWSVEEPPSSLSVREDSHLNSLDNSPRAISQHLFSIRDYPEYYEIFVDKLLEQYQLRCPSPLSESIKSVARSSWVSSVIQTILTPNDVALMYRAFQEVDPIHHEATRADQVEIGKQTSS